MMGVLFLTLGLSFAKRMAWRNTDFHDNVQIVLDELRPAILDCGFEVEYHHCVNEFYAVWKQPQQCFIRFTPVDAPNA